jgi:drug/metabolite transporter (DMT)-like permease
MLLLAHAEAMPRSPRLVATLALAATILLWGSAFPAIGLALTAFSPGELSVVRLAVAAVALALVAPMLRIRRPAAADLGRIVLCGLTGMTAYQLLLNGGQQTVPAGTASLLIALSPIATALLARALLRERLDAVQWTGMAVAFSGAAILALRHGTVLSIEPGALAVVAAALSQAVFFVASKPLLARYRGVELTAYATWVGAAVLLPLAGGALDAVRSAPGAALAAVAWLGLGTSAVGFVTWAAALARLPAGVAANSLSLVPLVALSVAWLLLGEVPGPPALAGGALCLVGVALVRRGRRTLSSPVPSAPAAPRSAAMPRPS